MSKIFYLTAFIAIFNCQLSMSQCHPNDWIALNQLYEQTDGDNWTIKTNWTIVGGEIPPSNCNLSLLEGITLNESNRVSGIELSDNNLVGTIPTEIGLLLELDEMQLTDNSLSGNLPAEIGLLQNLATLELENNNLSGVLPPEIGNLIKLEFLSLNNNNLTGAIPSEFGNLIVLSDLLLNNNQLSGCFDEDLSALCDYYNNIDVTTGNNFDATWANFCSLSEGQCSNCVDALTLSSGSNSNQTYQAGQSITSTETIGANITYRAGSFIWLDDNFCASAAFDFSVLINECN